MLVAPELREFSELIGVKMSPGVLLRKLQSRGVNIMPTSDDDFHSIKEITRKDDILSNEVLNQVYIISDFFFVFY
jgi:hypothetical protein